MVFIEYCLDVKWKKPTGFNHKFATSCQEASMEFAISD